MRVCPQPTIYKTAALRSVPLGSVQTTLAELTHILLPRQSRYVPFSQRGLLAVLLADESGDARAIGRLNVAWTRSRAPAADSVGAARRSARSLSYR